MTTKLVESRGKKYAIKDYDDVLTLSSEERNLLRAIAAELSELYMDHMSADHLDNPELILECENIFRRQAPERLVNKLSEYRRFGNQSGVLLLRNMPTDDDLPATPSNGEYQENWKKVGIATIVQLMVTASLGEIISYADEKSGRIIQDIIPVKGKEHRQENSGSCLLEFHTENGFHPSRPRYVTLMGLRGNPDALTLSSGIREALNKLDWQTLETLTKPGFKIRFSSSFTEGKNSEDVLSNPLAVLSGSMHDPDLCVDFHATVPLNNESQQALAALEQVLLDGICGATVLEGDIIIIDNDKAVHGRTSFKPTGDERDRWLRRCFAVADLRVSSAARKPMSHVHREITFIPVS